MAGTCGKQPIASTRISAIAASLSGAHVFRAGGIHTGVGHLPEPALHRMTANAPASSHKTPAQGAATTVWAAIGHEWEGQGGKYLEDCSIGQPHDEGDKTWGAPGYAAWAFDERAAVRLWEESVKLVALKRRTSLQALGNLQSLVSGRRHSMWS